MDHRDRQRAYRARQAARVTDQSSAALAGYGTMAARLAPAPITERRRLYESRMAGRIVCRFCGRRGRWVQMFHTRE